MGMPRRICLPAALGRGRASPPPFSARTPQSLPTYLISLVDSHALPQPRGLEVLIVASDGNATVGGGASLGGQGGNGCDGKHAVAMAKRLWQAFELAGAGSLSSQALASKLACFCSDGHGGDDSASSLARQ